MSIDPFAPERSFAVITADLAAGEAVTIEAQRAAHYLAETGRNDLSLVVECATQQAAEAAVPWLISLTTPRAIRGAVDISAVLVGDAVIDATVSKAVHELTQAEAEAVPGGWAAISVLGV